MVRCDEIPGFLVAKKPVHVNEPNNVFNQHFNNALTQQGSKCLRMNREKLARVLYMIYEYWKNHPNYKDWEELPKDSPVYCQCMNNADTINKNLKDLLEVVQ
jgi:hypothetical protein